MYQTTTNNFLFNPVADEHLLPKISSSRSSATGGGGGNATRSTIPTENKEKLDGLKREVDDVRVIMVNNLEKTLKRGEDIDDMLIKSEELEHSANTFQRASKVLKKKMCCQNFKSSVTLTLVAVILISLLILVIVLSTKPWNN
jgi:hypothetical protein